jgi:hypothetical protein
MLEDIPRKYKGLYKTARDRKHRKAAIRFHCLHCAGYNDNEVRKCTSKDCVFYPYRLKG